VIDNLAAAAIFPFRGTRGKISSRVNQFLPLALLGVILIGNDVNLDAT
jgi:hypothetical protein